DLFFPGAPGAHPGPLRGCFGERRLPGPRPGRAPVRRGALPVRGRERQGPGVPPAARGRPSRGSGMRLKLALAFMVTTFLFITVNFVFTPPNEYAFWDLVGYVSGEILIGLIAAVILSKYFTRHLRELAAVSTIISQGDLRRK